MRGATILLTSCSLAIASCAETQDIHVRAVGAPSGLQGEALDEYLDRLTRQGPTFSELGVTHLASKQP